MNYVVRKGNSYYYSRRVPKELKEYDPRLYVRIALKTDSLKQAKKSALLQNEQVERYWNALVGSGQKHEHTLYQNAVNRATTFGFTYMPNPVLAAQPLPEIINRLDHVEQHSFQQLRVEAVLGGLAKPKLKLDGALERYFDISKDKIVEKSTDQIRKWKNIRTWAVKNFIKIVGNKPIDEITRDDILKFRDWWLGRIRAENLKSNSANKNFIQLHMIIKTVSKNDKLEIDYKYLFEDLLLNEDDMGTRQPFTTEWLLTKILVPGALNGLDLQARCALFAFAETGSGIAEQLSLSSEVIRLDTEIPFIHIKRQKQNVLKTKYRPRQIPLVGFALDAFRECPNGFTDYKNCPDYLSNLLRTFLNDRRMFPSVDHTLYSLRHSFQDRLLAKEAPERVQADLMGHKYSRQPYGSGASLSQKMNWMQRIQLKNNCN